MAVAMMVNSMAGGVSVEWCLSQNSTTIDGHIQTVLGQSDETMERTKQLSGINSSLFSRSDGSEQKLYSLCVTIFLTTVTSLKQGRIHMKRGF